MKTWRWHAVRIEIGGIAIGLVAMMRIFRQGPEDVSSSWRAFRR
ncbi:MAG TPA: hypothetical protein VGJ71_03015 [Candidatus Limnocylindrales bacterium]|jgi:hypothetical protein